MPVTDNLKGHITCIILLTLFKFIYISCFIIGLYFIVYSLIAFYFYVHILETTNTLNTDK